jgi:arylsulfatase A-like enzyme
MNILFIMTDQQRVDFLSIYGNKVLQTPAMDRIGREGTVFKKAFVQAAICGVPTENLILPFSAAILRKR